MFDSICRNYVYGNYIDEALLYQVEDGYRMYFLHDHLYSPAAIVSQAGSVAERYEYDVYGKRAVMTNSFGPRTYSMYANDFGLTGREVDDLDFNSSDTPCLQRMHYRYRDYSPFMGRFVQQDPLGDVDGLNLYEYVISNPMTNYDPFGLVCGSGWSDPVVPDHQYVIPNPFGNADFTPACQDHDNCYGGTGGGGCNTDKEDCDKGLRDGMKDACNKEYSGWKRIAFPGQYADCLLKAQIYYQAVKRMGQGAFDAARKNNPNCNSCSSQPQTPIRPPRTDDYGNPI